MKFLLLGICILFSGCTVLDQSSYFTVVGAADKTFDAFNAEYSYVTKENESIIVHSKAFKQKSLAIGLIIPIIPQINRDDRLVYDINRDRCVRIENKGKVNCVLQDLGSIQQKESEYSKKSKEIEQIPIKPGESVWLVLPDQAELIFQMKIGNETFKMKIKETTKYNINAVTV